MTGIGWMGRVEKGRVIGSDSDGISSVVLIG